MHSSTPLTLITLTLLSIYTTNASPIPGIGPSAMRDRAHTTCLEKACTFSSIAAGADLQTTRLEAEVAHHASLAQSLDLSGTAHPHSAQRAADQEFQTEQSKRIANAARAAKSRDMAYYLADLNHAKVEKFREQDREKGRKPLMPEGKVDHPPLTMLPGFDVVARGYKGVPAGAGGAGAGAAGTGTTSRGETALREGEHKAGEQTGQGGQGGQGGTGVRGGQTEQSSRAGTGVGVGPEAAGTGAAGLAAVGGIGGSGVAGQEPGPGARAEAGTGAGAHAAGGTAAGHEAHGFGHGFKPRP